MKRKIDEIIADGDDYSSMLTGSEPGGKTGIQKWFESELQSVVAVSAPDTLRTHYFRLKEKLQRLEERLMRM